MARNLVFLDTETTGLDPDSDAVLSLGWVPVSHGEIRLDGARQVVVRPPPGTELGDSVALHGLTDDLLEQAPSLAEVLPEVLTALRGRTLVAHHARIETGFLAAAVRRTYETTLPLVCLDTLALQHRLVADEHGQVPEGSLRLDRCRRRYGLPRYPAHQALTDALGAAELVLAQAAEAAHRWRREPTLADLGARIAR